MHYKEFFPDKPNLKASDIKGMEVPVTVEAVTGEEFDGKKKPVLSFVGKSKRLPLNLTNAVKVANIYGDDVNMWVGKPIILFTEVVNGPEGLTDGIRIKAPSVSMPGNTPPQLQQQQQPAPNVMQSNDFDDDIPF